MPGVTIVAGVPIVADVRFGMNRGGLVVMVMVVFVRHGNRWFALKRAREFITRESQPRSRSENRASNTGCQRS